jgi:hypothetical protein
MILILTEPRDTHADHVVEILKTRGAEVVRFHPEDFPARANLSIGYRPARYDAVRDRISSMASSFDPTIRNWSIS